MKQAFKQADKQAILIRQKGCGQTSSGGAQRSKVEENTPIGGKGQALFVFI
jgi:hypothetical protein